MATDATVCHSILPHPPAGNFFVQAVEPLGTGSDLFRIRPLAAQSAAFLMRVCLPWRLVCAFAILLPCCTQPMTGDQVVGGTDAGTDVPDSAVADSDAGDGGPAAIAASALLAADAKMYCRWPKNRDRCSLEITDHVPETCYLQRMNLSELLRERIRLVELGRLQYDGAAAGSCIAAATCENVDAIHQALGGFVAAVKIRAKVPDVCWKVFSGTKQAGQPCDDDAECAQGRCWGKSGAVCMTPSKHGEACGANAPCAIGDLCDAGTCVTDVPLPVGATCANPDDIGAVAYANDFYDTVLTCDVGLRCRGSKTLYAGTCTVTAPDGAKCKAWFNCGMGKDCVGGICQPALYLPSCGTATTCSESEHCDPSNWSCKPWAKPGSVCDASTDCADGQCQPDSTCSATNLCGSTCPFIKCSGTGVCQIARLGDACASNTDCKGVPGLAPTMLCIDKTCRRINVAQTWK